MILNAASSRGGVFPWNDDVLVSVTLSERVPPSESKGPPKQGGCYKRWTPNQPSGDSSTRSMTRSLPKNKPGLLPVS